MNSVRSRPSPLPTYDVCPVLEGEREGVREKGRRGEGGGENYVSGFRVLGLGFFFGEHSCYQQSRASA